MIFIDADHKYESVLADINWSLEKGIPVISGHDYNWPEIARAVNESFGNKIIIEGSVWIHVAGQ